MCAADPVNDLDQRGVVRPEGAHCDIGAYEFIDPPVAPADATGQDVTHSITLSATVVTTCGDAVVDCPVINNGTVTFNR